VLGCSYKGLPESRTNVRNPIGCNMSFRKKVFEKIGYFRTDIGRYGRKLLGSEETELSMRIPRGIPNSKIVYDPSAIVYHKVDYSRVNPKYLVKRSFYEGLSKALLIGSKENLSNTLSTENQYFNYLMKKAIPSRIKRIFKLRDFLQLFTLLLSMCTVSVGFLGGRLYELSRGKTTNEQLEEIKNIETREIGGVFL
jgi:GT2 family glycosyltransferase